MLYSYCTVKPWSQHVALTLLNKGNLEIDDLCPFETGIEDTVVCDIKKHGMVTH